MDGETFPRQWNNLLDLSRAIVSQLLGGKPSKMWTYVKGRLDQDDTLCAMTSEERRWFSSSFVGYGGWQTTDWGITATN